MKQSFQFVGVALAANLLINGGIAHAQSTAGECEQLISQLKLHSQKLREDEKRARSAAEQLALEHPLVVKLADGRIVNLSGEAELSKPLESWTRALDISRKAQTDLEEAGKLLEALKQDDCIKLLEPYKFNRG